MRFLSLLILLSMCSNGQFLVFTVDEGKVNILQTFDWFDDKTMMIPKNRHIVFGIKSGGYYQFLGNKQIVQSTIIKLDDFFKVRSTWCLIEDIPKDKTGDHALLFFFKASNGGYTHLDYRVVGVSNDLHSASVTLGLSSGNWKMALVKQVDIEKKIRFDVVDVANLEIKDKDLTKQKPDGFKIKWKSLEAEKYNVKEFEKLIEKAQYLSVLVNLAVEKQNSQRSDP